MAFNRETVLRSLSNAKVVGVSELPVAVSPCTLCEHHYSMCSGGIVVQIVKMDDTHVIVLFYGVNYAEMSKFMSDPVGIADRATVTSSIDVYVGRPTGAPPAVNAHATA